MKKIQRKLIFNECLEIRWKTAHFLLVKSLCLRSLLSSTIKHSTQVFLCFITKWSTKHLVVRQKYSPLSVSSGDETRLMLDTLHQALLKAYWMRKGVGERGKKNPVASKQTHNQPNKQTNTCTNHWFMYLKTLFSFSFQSLAFCTIPRNIENITSNTIVNKALWLWSPYRLLCNMFLQASLDLTDHNVQ